MDRTPLTCAGRCGIAVLSKYQNAGGTHACHHQGAGDRSRWTSAGRSASCRGPSRPLVCAAPASRSRRPRTLDAVPRSSAGCASGAWLERNEHRRIDGTDKESRVVTPDTRDTGRQQHADRQLVERPVWVGWSAAALAQAADADKIAINPIIYGELATGFARIEDLDAALPTGIYRRLDLAWPAAFLARRTSVANFKTAGSARARPCRTS